MVEKLWPPRRNIADNRESIKAIIIQFMEHDTKICSSTIACKKPPAASFKLTIEHENLHQ